MTDSKTREKNSSQGQGWHGDSEGHAKAGKKGGDKLAEERGSEYFEQIGRDGANAKKSSGDQG